MLVRQSGFFLAVLSAIVSFLWSPTAHADERLLVDATINDQPVHLAFDTGAETLILFELPATHNNTCLRAPE